MKHTIDATNKKLGRVASEAAALLNGKKSVTFTRNTVEPVVVEIINASKADISEKKLNEKNYVRYSGYPGGLKAPSMKNIVEKKGYAEVFTLAVYGMIPSNRLRAKCMKNLIVKE
ncbi:MAG: 50S ribosomal protein L13 [Candidatus Taylorbacteria bacterium]|nr:50S ribosomal protein L13 [Candidatus Taylorbacteria bacterium]